MHWPERVMNMFQKRSVQEIDTKMARQYFDVLTVYDGLIKEGKIKHIGVSNENPWVLCVLMESEKHGLLRIYDSKSFSVIGIVYMKLVCQKLKCVKNVGLLAYSPLGFGF